MHDQRKVRMEPNAIYEYVFPIVASKKDEEELLKYVKLCDKMIQVLEMAPYKCSWPRCLRFCCFKGLKRTSCYCRYSLLFGQIKQLGFILQT